MEIFELDDGTQMNLTLKMGMVMKLKGLNPVAYNNYKNAALQKGRKEDADELQNAIDIIYAGYLCAKIENDTYSEAMDYETFIDTLPVNPALIVIESSVLTNPKLKRAFAKRSDDLLTKSGAAAETE